MSLWFKAEQNGDPYIDTPTKGRVVDVVSFGADPTGQKDAFDPINRAINNLNNGDILYFPNGTYAILSDPSSTTLFNFDSINDLKVVGDNAEIKIADNSNGIVEKAFDFNKCDNIKFSGFTFDLDNSSYSGQWVEAVQFNGCIGVEVMDNYFFDVGHAIVLSPDTDAFAIACKDVYIHRNRGINGGGLAQTTANYSDKVVAHNLVTLKWGDGLPVTNNLVISNNIIDGFCVGYMQGVRNLLVSNNISDNSIDTSIYLDNYIKNFSITGNIVTNAGKDAIKILQTAGSGSFTPATVFGYGTVTGNYLNGAGQVASDGNIHIVLEGGRDVSISGNTIKFAPTTINSTNEQSGIYVQSSSNVNVSSNVINGSEVEGSDDDCNGIVIRGGSGNSAGNLNSDSENIIVNANNVEGIMGNGIQALAGFYAGTDYDLKGLKITNNVVKLRDNGAIGIKLYASANSNITDADIMYNTVSGHRLNAVSVEPVNTATFTNVRVENNISRNHYVGGSFELRFWYQDANSYAGYNTVKNNRTDGSNAVLLRFEGSAEDYFAVSGNIDDDTIVAGVDVRDVKITSGEGVPTAADPNGSLFIRTDGGAGTTLYVRENGAWAAK